MSIKYTDAKLYVATKRIAVRQVLVDSQPAVEVTAFERGHYYEGDTIPGESVVSRHYYRFPTPKPIELFGMPVVGQWSDKKISGHGKVEDNPDPATYIDYEAWVEAFHQVYSES